MTIKEAVATVNQLIGQMNCAELIAKAETETLEDGERVRRGLAAINFEDVVDDLEEVALFLENLGG